MDVLSDMQENLTIKLMKTFNVNADQAARLLLELKQCVKRKNLVSSIEGLTINVLRPISSKSIHIWTFCIKLANTKIAGSLL